MCSQSVNRKRSVTCNNFSAASLNSKSIRAIPVVMRYRDDRRTNNSSKTNRLTSASFGKCFDDIRQQLAVQSDTNNTVSHLVAR
jgi:hypothetical protein